MSSDKIELLPCPLHGGVAHLSQRELDERCGYNTTYKVSVECCSLNMTGTGKQNDKGWKDDPKQQGRAELITAWNTRIAALVGDAEVERKIIDAIEAKFDIHAMDPEDWAEMSCAISAALTRSSEDTQAPERFDIPNLTDVEHDEMVERINGITNLQPTQAPDIEMVDHVARAIYESRRSCTSFEGLEPAVVEAMRVKARAAILAVRNRRNGLGDI
jgi:hypothetical protein